MNALANTPLRVPRFYSDIGARVVPVQRGCRGPRMLDWPNTQMNAEEAEQLANSDPDYDKVAWVLDDHHLVIDIDTHDADKNGYESLARLSEDLGVDLACLADAVVDSPSGGKHLYFSKPAHTKTVKALSDYPGLDFLTAGRVSWPLAALTTESLGPIKSIRTQS